MAVDSAVRSSALTTGMAHLPWFGFERSTIAPAHATRRGQTRALTPTPLPVRGRGEKRTAGCPCHSTEKAWDRRPQSGVGAGTTTGDASVARPSFTPATKLAP